MDITHLLSAGQPNDVPETFYVDVLEKIAFHCGRYQRLLRSRAPSGSEPCGS